jgi:hypothetical protein
MKYAGVRKEKNISFVVNANDAELYQQMIGCIKE